MKKQVQYDIRDYSISEICVFIEDKDTGKDYKDCMEINTTQGYIETYFADKTEKLLGIDMTEDINDRHINHLKNLHDVNINEILNEYEETQEYLKNKNKNLGGN